MIGYVTAAGRGVSDRVMVASAALMQAQGLRLVGAVQHNPAGPDGTRCHMDLHLPGCGQTLRISQNLGPQATGCRLDAAAMAQALWLVERDLVQGADVVIVNKFAGQEASGGGFRDIIANAVSQGVPVVLAVSPDARAAFHDFAMDLAVPLVADPQAICAWALQQTGR